MKLVRALGAAAAVAALGISSTVTGWAPAAAALSDVPKVGGETMDRAQIRDAVIELADMLERTYVFPDVARHYAARLRANLAAGAYDGMSEPAALAAALDADLRAVRVDGHMHVQVVDDTPRAASRGSGPRGFPFGDGAWMRDGVAYLPVTVLPMDEAAQARMAELLDSYAGARALILDLRTCYGGGMPVMDVLLSRLYGAPTHLVTMDTRAGVDPDFEAHLDSVQSLERVDAPDSLARWRHWARPAATGATLADARVYVLTGHTASACEHLALALQRTGRATLVGGQTRGAGHYGGTRRFGERFETFVGIGRTYDPDTGEGWEGTGVTPNVVTAPEDALDHVLGRLGVAPQASSSTSQ